MIRVLLLHDRKRKRKTLDAQICYGEISYKVVDNSVHLRLKGYYKLHRQKRKKRRGLDVRSVPIIPLCNKATGNRCCLPQLFDYHLNSSLVLGSPFLQVKYKHFYTWSCCCSFSFSQVSCNPTQLLQKPLPAV